jgi:hypothetical protein
MTKTTLAVKAFISKQDCKPLTCQNLEKAVEAICCSEQFKSLLLSLIDSPAFSQELGAEFGEVDAVKDTPGHLGLKLKLACYMDTQLRSGWVLVLT